VSGNHQLSFTNKLWKKEEEEICNLYSIVVIKKKLNEKIPLFFFPSQPNIPKNQNDFSRRGLGNQVFYFFGTYIFISVYIFHRVL
jgi:hypothetical protein